MAPCIMAQTAGFEPPGPFYLNIADGHPQTRSQDLISTVKIMKLSLSEWLFRVENVKDPIIDKLQV